MLEVIKNKENSRTDINKWFDDMVSDLRVDQLSMQTEVIEKRKKEVYEAMISGDADFLHDYARTK